MIEKDQAARPGKPSITLASTATYASQITPGASGAAAVGLTTTASAPSTITVADMLSNVVRGYLLGDLESMATEIQPKPMGGVGYPMVMAVLSGSEP